MKKIGLLAIALGVIGSAANAERMANTPSGLADAIFQGTSTKDAAGKLASHCMDKGWQIASQTESQVVCEIPMNVLKSALTQALIGNSYSTPPRSFVKFSIAQIQEHARVQANGWVETQMAFGQMRQQPYTDDNTFNGLLGFMGEIGAELPPGTTFPGVFIGIDGTVQSDGSRFWRQVSRVFPNSAAEAAGLKAGDQITKIAGRGFKDDQSWRKAINKFSPGVHFPVVIIREGKTMTVQVEARARPAVGTPEFEMLKTAASSPPATAAPGLEAAASGTQTSGQPRVGK